MEQLLPSLSFGTLFTLLVAVPTLIAFAVGFSLFVPESSPRKFFAELVHTDWKYLGVAWLVTQTVNTLAANFHSGAAYTAVIYDLEGTAVLYFQSVTWEPLTYFMAFVYLIGFPFLTLFTYFKLKVHDREQARRYCAGYALLVLLALPYFLAFPVAVTSEYLGQTASGEPVMQALLYDLHPIVSEGITSTDTLVKAFPSLHTGISAMAALYARETDRSYAWLAGILTVLIMFSTFYLGVHWLSDAAFALVLVGIAYYISQRMPDPAVYEARVARLLPVGGDDTESRGQRAD